MILPHIAGEFNVCLPVTLLPHRFNIACGLRVVSSRDNQLHIRNLVAELAERFNHQLESLVCSPLAERQNPVGIAAPRKIRRLWTLRQNAMRPNVHIVPTVFLRKDFPIARHEH
jgi:hypothetical protein